MWNQSQTASAPMSLSPSQAPGVATPMPVRERLAGVRETLLKCHSVAEHLGQVLEPTPQKDAPGGPTGPMGLESITNDLAVLANALADRLQYVAARLGG